MMDFIQLLKLPPSILAAVVMGTGLILFLPMSILQKLGLNNIPELWRTILGFSFIISISVLVVVALLYRSPNYTSRLPYADGVTIRLKNKNIIQLTSSKNVAYGDNMFIPFTITPIAQKYVDKHPELIENYSKSKLENMYQGYNSLFY